MRTEITSVSGTSQRPNEDYVSVALPASGWGGVMVVLDGVTPPPSGGGCTHGVPWYTARLGGSMLELSGSRRDLTLTQCLTSALSRTAEAHASTCDLSHPRTPQATVVAARWDEETVEYLVLSDSVLLLERSDGSVTAVLDPRLSQLPQPVRASGAYVHTLPRGTPERNEARVQYARAVEALRNAPDGSGFFTAAADPAVAARAVTGALPRGGTAALLGLTDGTTRWSDVFGLGDWTELFRTARTSGTASLVAQVRAAERADPDGDAYPRGKTSDDASAALVEL